MNTATAPLEWKLTDPAAFGLTTASKLQRDICKLLDGRLRETIKATGNVSCAGLRPKELAVIAGVRGGKSLIAACHALHMSQIVDVSKLGPGEIPRIPILSVFKDEAYVIFQHLLGRVKASEVFRDLLLEELSDSCLLKHPTGRPIEVKIVAGARAGTSLTARWMAGCVADEFPRMHGSADGAVINWSESRAVVLPRLLPNAQMLHIGSPHAPFGPAYEMVQERFGKPGRDLVVIRAPSYELNPHLWTPELVEEYRSTPSFRTDIMAEFASPVELFFSAELLEKCVRPQRQPEPRCSYVAALDPATRANGWTLVIGSRRGNVRRIVRAVEWRGSSDKPLSPREVLREIAETVKPYGITSLYSDQWSGDALNDLSAEFGLSILQCRPTEAEKVHRYFSMKRWMEESQFEIPREVCADLVRVQKAVTTTGVAVRLPLTNDGRHCDFAPSLMLVAAAYIEDVKADVIPIHPDVVKMREAARLRYGTKRGEQW